MKRTNYTKMSKKREKTLQICSINSLINRKHSFCFVVKKPMRKRHRQVRQQPLRRQH